MKWNHQLIPDNRQIEFPVFQLTLAFLKSWLLFFWSLLLNMWVWSLVFSGVGSGFYETLENNNRSCSCNSIFPLKSSDKFQSPPNILISVAWRFIKLSRTEDNIFRNFVRIKQKIHLLHTVKKTTSLPPTCSPVPWLRAKFHPPLPPWWGPQAAQAHAAVLNLPQFRRLPLGFDTELDKWQSVPYSR